MMNKKVIEAVMEACDVDSTLTYRPRNNDSLADQIWPTVLRKGDEKYRYHSQSSFYYTTFLECLGIREHGSAEAIVNVIAKHSGITVEGKYDGEEFWFDFLYDPPEDAQPQGDLTDEGIDIDLDCKEVVEGVLLESDGE